MKAILALFYFVALAIVTSAAPAQTDTGPPQVTPEPEPPLEELQRVKRSHYGNYGLPCAGASGAAFGPAIGASFGPGAYHYGGIGGVGPVSGVGPIGPVGGIGPISSSFHGFEGGHGFGFGHPQFVHQSAPLYRSDAGEEDEMLSFSDMDPMAMEHMPMARYDSYGGSHVPISGPVVGSLGPIGGPGPMGPIIGAGPVVGPMGNIIGPGPVVGSIGGVEAFGGSFGGHVAAGPSFAVFPRGNGGNCNVPLLLSCSPSIVRGQIVKGHPQYDFAAASGGGIAAVSSHGGYYRGVDDPRELQSTPEKKISQEQTKSEGIKSSNIKETPK